MRAGRVRTCADMSGHPDRTRSCPQFHRGFVLLLPSGYVIAGGASPCAGLLRRHQRPAGQDIRQVHLGTCRAVFPARKSRNRAQSRLAAGAPRPVVDRLRRRARSCREPPGDDGYGPCGGWLSFCFIRFWAISGAVSIRSPGCLPPCGHGHVCHSRIGLAYWPAFVFFAGFAWFNLFIPAPKTSEAVPLWFRPIFFSRLRRSYLRREGMAGQGRSFRRPSCACLEHLLPSAT